MRMGLRGHVTANAPLYTNLVNDENIRRLRGIPIFLFSGSENSVLNPESTNRTYEILRDKLGGRGGGYEGMGHGPEFFDRNRNRNWNGSGSENEDWQEGKVEKGKVVGEEGIRMRGKEKGNAGRRRKGLMYERVEVPGYGHLDCWMGRRAYMDVYPMVRERVDRVVRGRDYEYQEVDWETEAREKRKDV